MESISSGGREDNDIIRKAEMINLWASTFHLKVLLMLLLMNHIKHPKQHLCP